MPSVLDSLVRWFSDAKGDTKGSTTTKISSKLRDNLYNKLSP